MRAGRSEAESTRGDQELRPEIAQNLGRRILFLAWMYRRRRAPFPLRFDVAPHLGRRHSDNEATAGVRQQPLRFVVGPPRQLDEAVADQRRFTDQQMLGSRMTPVPPDEGATGPESDRLANHGLC